MLVEHNDEKVSAATLHALTAAAKVGGEVSVLAVGKGIDSVVAEAGKLAGVTRVLYANCDASGFLAEAISPIIAGSQKQFNFTHIFAAATATGKNVLPRVAAKLDVELISDIQGVEGEDTFTRAIYAGSNNNNNKKKRKKKKR
mgnify:CR=1 FL=1